MKKGQKVIAKTNIDIKNCWFMEDCLIKKDNFYIIENIYSSDILDKGEGIFYLGKKMDIIRINGCNFPHGKKQINEKDITIFFEDYFISLAEWRDIQINSILD